MHPPSTLFIFHLHTAMEIITSISIRNRSVMEQPRPSLFTSNGRWKIIPYSSQGNGNLNDGRKKMRHMFTSEKIQKNAELILLRPCEINWYGRSLKFHSHRQVFNRIRPKVSNFLLHKEITDIVKDDSLYRCCLRSQLCQSLQSSEYV